MKPWGCLWLLLPLAIWLVAREWLLKPAEAELRLSQLDLLAAERAELQGSIELQRARRDVESLQRRRNVLIADARRLKMVERAAREKLGTDGVSV
ncbi:hypothetical protein AB1Y20_018917 [Prymnesium parvum]|uniref:Uncharacterized protein n=1 Tax=Prymnesium parvum TaxID=97485 RepID=A0AB34JSQ5_PRYPA